METLNEFWLWVQGLPSRESFWPIILTSLTLALISLMNPRALFSFVHWMTEMFFLTMERATSADPELAELKEKLDRMKERVDELSSGGGTAGAEAMHRQMGTAEEWTSNEFYRRELLAEVVRGFDKPRADTADVIQQVILFRLQEAAEKDTADLPLDQLVQMRSRAVEEETRWRQQRRLDTVFTGQLDSAASIRRAMINLFVLVNFILIGAIIFRATDVLSNKEIILGLYVSFATFIVYVYRSSNARALILIAGIEDNKRYHDVDKYLQYIGKRGPNERDIEALKMLLINRMEREKNSEHPYELVLKGISNSNILMKGGKVSSVEKKERSE